ncbi:hypothetical protein [Bradyrhizobium elkanii]|uniref:hypothetical protein n=1 Tax=Bradyrhizobium elkanii TaxID=29448 RepID=UPI00209FD4A1|nr:hypothetical protein [Bradyrhizobium elkanii]MCP1970828.1 hypothetical protein [Bradyrhizobium elkanii]MCS4107665.1 hypothetical protein [Bradyrhizobium elkanii]
MKACEAVIAWTPAWKDDVNAGIVDVFQLGAPIPIRYRRTAGAAFVPVQQLRGMTAVARLFIDFNTLVVRDGIDPQRAHTAFMKVDEYVAYTALERRGVSFQSPEITRPSQSEGVE